jgi:hypothetical protein
MRSAVKWISTLAAIVCTALWWVNWADRSLIWVGSDKLTWIGISRGQLAALRYEPSLSDYPFGLGPGFHLWLRPMPISMGFEWLPKGGLFLEWSYAIPLWLPFAVTASVATVLWRNDVLRLRRERAHLCPLCGYDLRGLACDVVCPECGSKPISVGPDPRV